MAHESLYRIYRPSTFADVAGQEQVTKPLEEAVKNKKIGHAYLFAGSRGLGKTSVARIFASAIGCSERDLFEMDAASNNSVEDIRSLTEGVYTLPFSSPYKVYILDEAHMLSKSAWNAFLKTLEEPPSHAVFIMATTELEKIPETVQSRCQVFEFKKPMRKGLTELVVRVTKKEGKEIMPDAAELIAVLADGSYRDALSILQKVFATAPAALTRRTVELATGAPKSEQVLALLAAIAEANRAKALAVINQTASSGVDMKIFLKLVLEALRATLLIRYAPELHEALKAEHGLDEFNALISMSDTSGKGDKSKYLSHKTLLAFLNASEQMRYAPIPSLPLELAVMELMSA